MPAWPSTLPQLFQLSGYEETESDNIIRTPMDKGPPKVRRRGSDAPRLLTANMWLDGTQYSIFRDFVRNTLKDRSLTIDSGLNDAHGVERTWRIVRPPKYLPLGNDNWRVTLELEELP